ncbi:MAG: 50S ribosomal protein L15 [Anaerolineales bacterium]|nr:50S ribosomal protein L15 [Anaerolineales bacterium]
MKLHELKPQTGSTAKRKRVGRGISAGQGKTAGRGTKGQKSRAGSGGNLYRQGGNLPFYRRLPFKRGFTNINRVEYFEVNVDTLAENFRKNAVVTPDSLAQAGLIKDTSNPVVVLGRGELDKPLKLQVHRITTGARAKVEAAGGTIELIEG